MTDIKKLVEECAREICRSGKFECGQGRCAVLCMDSLGDVRKSPHGCSHSVRLHGAMARAVIRRTLEWAAGEADAEIQHQLGVENAVWPCERIANRLRTLATSIEAKEGSRK